MTSSNTGAPKGTFALGYAGLEERVLTLRAKELSVDGIALTDVNIRHLSYPFAHFLYVNYNRSMLARSTSASSRATFATAREKAFLCDNVLANDPTLGCPLGGVDRTFAFENLLVNSGFLRCSTSMGPFACSLVGAPQLSCP